MEIDIFELAENWERLYDMINEVEWNGTEFDEEYFKETTKATFHAFFDKCEKDKCGILQLLLAVHKFSLHPIGTDGFIGAAKLVAQNLCEQYAGYRVFIEDDNGVDLSDKYFYVENENDECGYNIDIDTFDISEIVDSGYEHFI